MDIADTAVRSYKALCAVKASEKQVAMIEAHIKRLQDLKTPRFKVGSIPYHLVQLEIAYYDEMLTVIKANLDGSEVPLS